MTTKEQAEALATKAAEIFSRKRVRLVFSEIVLKSDILSTIPLVELLECVEALRFLRIAVTNDGFEPVCNNPLSESAFTRSMIKMEKALTNLDAKLNEKGQL